MKRILFRYGLSSIYILYFRIYKQFVIVLPCAEASADIDLDQARAGGRLRQLPCLKVFEITRFLTNHYSYSRRTINPLESVNNYSTTGPIPEIQNRAP